MQGCFQQGQGWGPYAKGCLLQTCAASEGDVEAREGRNGSGYEWLLVIDGWREGKLPEQREGHLAEGMTLLHQPDPDSAGREGPGDVHSKKIPTHNHISQSAQFKPLYKTTKVQARTVDVACERHRLHGRQCLFWAQTLPQDPTEAPKSNRKQAVHEGDVESRLTQLRQQQQHARMVEQDCSRQAEASETAQKTVDLTAETS